MKQKGFALIVIILVIVVLGVVGYFVYRSYLPRSYTKAIPLPLPFITFQPQPDWKTYTDSKYKYQLQYPNDWTLKIDNIQNTIIFYPSKTKIYPGKPTDPSVTMGVFDISTSKISGVSDYDTWLKYVTFDKVFPFTNVGNIMLENITADHFSGVFHGTNGVSARDVYIFKNTTNDVFYAIILDDFDSTNFEETLNQILSSFKFTQ